ncbi:unnamed protein product, partial [Tuber aestivum]
QRQRTAPAPHQFELVSSDEFGAPHPLPRELGDLPLYPDEDGFYSVNGPLDLTILPSNVAVPPVDRGNHVTFHPLTNQTQHLADQQHPHISPHHRQRSSSHLSGEPHTRPERRNHSCDQPGCAWPSSFSTRQALTRHREAVHLNLRVDCPIPGCERVGDKGISRKDNLPAHV